MNSVKGLQGLKPFLYLIRALVAVETATHEALFGAEGARGVYAGGADCGDGASDQGGGQD